MNILQHHLATSLEMRELDRIAIEDFGLPGIVLMENAARSIEKEIFNHWKQWPVNPTAAILIGPGQNGGDGWALARLLTARGFKVECFTALEDNRKIRGDAAINYRIARRMNIAVTAFKGAGEQPPDWRAFDLLIDAVFGTGLDRPVSDPAAALLDSAGTAKKELRERLRVLAVDIPSGLSGSDGKLWGPALPADLTVTLGALKIGLFSGQGPDLCGKIVVGDIGLTPEMWASALPKGRLANPETMAPLLPARPLKGHKGTFGHVLLAGGARGKTGALTLAAMGAARSGAALVTALHPASLAPIYETKLTEVMTMELPEDEAGELAESAGDLILEYAPGRQVLALGPGLGLGEGAGQAVERVVEGSPIPLVLDADALTHLAGHLNFVRNCSQPVVLTPHPGEAARLLSTISSSIEENRLEAARAIAIQSRAVVVLKGFHTIVAEPSGSFYLNNSGGAHMAVGGSGDLLTGLLAGLMAQGMPAFEAAALAVFVHGRAADLASAASGPFGLLPGDFAAFIPNVFKELSTVSSDSLRPGLG